MEVLHLVFLKRFDRSEAMERLERLELVRFWSEAYGCEFAQEMKRKDRKTRFCGRNLLKPLRLSVVRPVNSDFKDRQAGS